jgi:hypothetical protein
LSSLVLAITPFLYAKGETKVDAQQIEQIIGVKPSMTADGVVRVSWARNGVPVTVDGMPLKPFAGLGAWANWNL